MIAVLGGAVFLAAAWLLAGPLGAFVRSDNPAALILGMIVITVGVIAGIARMCGR